MSAGYAFLQQQSSVDRYAVVRWRCGVIGPLAAKHGLAHLPAASRDLPEWFRYVVNATAGTPVTAALLFLAHRCISAARSVGARETIEAYAYDLRAWFTFLAHEGVEWDRAEQTDFNEYVLDMASAVHADNAPEGEGLPALKHSTIARRAASLNEFYKDARGRSLTTVSFDTKIAKATGCRAATVVRPIVPADLKRLVLALGPLPSRRFGAESCRLALASMLALVSGLRLFEVCGLTVAQVTEAGFDRTEPMIERPVLLTTVKGQRQRHAMIPNWLLAELADYIASERADVMAQVGINHAALFVNHASAGPNAGWPLQPDTLSADFRRTVRALGLCRRLPGHPHDAPPTAAAHTFHDLRHTCACLNYVAYRRTMHDPLLEVQQRLGHRFSATTAKVYLAYVQEFGTSADGAVQSLIAEFLA